MNKGLMLPLTVMTIMALAASELYIPFDNSSTNSYKTIKHRSQKKRRRRRK